MSLTDSDSDEQFQATGEETEDEISVSDDDDVDGKPLQILQFERSSGADDTLYMKLNQKNLDKILESCETKPVCIISIVGPTRTGRSFMLSCIKEQLRSLEEDSSIMQSNHIKGFTFSAGCTSVTKGIWMWSKPFFVEGEDNEIAVLLMDSEGINDEFSKPEEISAIIGISLLSSSMFLINTSGDMSKHTFDWLSAFTANPKQLNFQNLTLLVRDWTRSYIFGFGNKGGKKLLSKFANDYSSRCSKVLKSFAETDCYLLPHIGEKALQKKFSGNTSDLSKEFSKYLKSFLNNLTTGNKLHAKKVLDAELTAYEFKQFFMEYVSFFNNPMEMELGPRPDKLVALIRETAGKIKITRAIEEYHKALQTRRKASLSANMKDADIDGLHAQARRKAIAAFKLFELPQSEEKHFLEKLEHQLNDMNNSRKQENKAARQNKLDENLQIACTRFQEELGTNFPFSCAVGRLARENLVFYEDTRISNVVYEVKQEIFSQFFAEFAEDDEDEIFHLRELLGSKLAPFETALKEKNNQNHENAQNHAEKVVEDLHNEYTSGLQKKIKRLRKLDEDTLLVFHDGEMERITDKFQKINLGTEEFQQDWLANLTERIETDLESMKLNLESTMADALQAIGKIILEHENELKELADAMDEDEILSYHTNKCEATLRKFKTENPYPETSSKHDEVESKLKRKLQEAYVAVVEHGILVQKDQEARLSAAVSRSLSSMKTILEDLIEDGDFLSEEECKSASKSAKANSLSEFDNDVLKIGADDNKTKSMRENLETEIKDFLQNWEISNTKTRTLAINEAEALVEECAEAYETKMSGNLKKIQSKDQLVKEHESAREAAIQQFQNQCTSTNSLLVAEHIQKIETRVDEIFDEVGEHFDMIKKNYEVGVRAALFDAKSHYQENMDKKFQNNKDGFFDDDTLKQMDKELLKEAETIISKSHKLNVQQLRKVVDHLKTLFQKYKDKNEVIRKSFETGKDVAIGIDLGTTYCCVAAFHMGDVKIIRNSLGNNITPSYVEIKADGTTVVGQGAKTNAFKNPESTIFDAKRMIGRPFIDPNVQKDMEFWPFTVLEEEGQARIMVHGKLYHPEQISSMILKHLKQEAEDMLGVKVSKAVITVPAYFTDGQRQATIDAGEIAGLDVLGILNEPTAAAVAYKLEWQTRGKDRHILVYDLGGGTFDVAILKINEAQLDVLTVKGDSHLGGEDFDQRLMTHCAKEFKAQTGIDLFQNKDSTNKTERDEARRRIKRLQINCEEAKKQLTTAPTTTIALDELVRGHDMSVDVRRKIFEDMNMDLFKRTIQIVDDALKSAKVQKQDIDDVVLVGGSTRIKKIQEMLEQHFHGKALNRRINPDEAVAYGAAVQAASLNAIPGTKIFDFGTIQEVTPMSLGIEVASGEMDVIVFKNTKFPVSKHEEYRTWKDGQTTASIKIYQGEEEMAVDNKLLGTFVLKGIPPGPAGTECVDVRMNININGILNVEAVCRSTKGKSSITVSEEKGRISKEEKRRLRDEVKFVEIMFFSKSLT